MESAPDDDDRSRRRQRFVEQIGLLFESLHLPRMTGRVFAALLIGPAVGLTAGELAARLEASKGSMSSSTRLLEQNGLIERHVLPPDRRDRFVVSADAWTRFLRDRLVTIRTLHALAEEGLALVEPSTDPRRLREVHDLYEFLENELPAVLARWEEVRGRD